jgi:hypothetical protein
MGDSCLQFNQWSQKKKEKRVLTSHPLTRILACCLQHAQAGVPFVKDAHNTAAATPSLDARRALAAGIRNMRLLAQQYETAAHLPTPSFADQAVATAANPPAAGRVTPQPLSNTPTSAIGRVLFEGWGDLCSMGWIAC